MSSSTAPSSAESQDFDTRHQKELSGKRFVITKGSEILIPLAGLAAGGALGYATLGKPIKALFPKFFSGINHTSDVVNSIGKIKGSDLQQAFEKIRETIPQVVEKAKKTDPHFELDSLGSIKKLFKHAEEKEILAVKDALGVPTRDRKTERWAGAAVLGLAGNIVGSIFVGYHKWRKEESTRLAAEEINKDISRLEVFSKRDPELVAENKRLREMLTTQSEAPGPAVGGAEHQGKLSETRHHHRG